MILWINGAHGVGKTTVARAILRARPDARLFDAEALGIALQRLWRPTTVPDFKDLPAWQEITALALRHFVDAEKPALVVVPMTVTNPDQLEQMTGALAAAGHEVRHVTLTAAPAVRQRRLRRRLDWPGSRRWSIANTEAAAAKLDDSRFGAPVPTDSRTPAEIARTLLDGLG